MALAARRRADDLRLGALAEEAGASPFHFHRVFSAVTSERPKEFTTRLRLDAAAAMLLSGRDTVLSIALRAGFESHEGFTRAFRRRFRITPSAYRERGFATPVTEVDAKTHARFVADVGPCIGLYHLSTDGNRRRNDVSYTITEKKLAPQPVLIGRRRVDPAGIAPAISEVLPKIFHLAQERGIAISGRPFTRYTDMSMGMMTVEPGMPVAALPPEGVRATDDDIHADMLPAGRAACTIHAGSYDELGQAYSALERWMSEKGVSPAGAPWESYLTDPAEHADPAEWKTEIFWPIR